MILPVVAYGHPVLRENAGDIDAGYPDLKVLINDMWETMYHSNGVGIAAPQINRAIRLFVVDTVQIVESFDEEDKKEFPDEKPVKQVFINAHVVNRDGEDWPYNEGCLSIPGVREDVYRPESVTLKYMDENFKEHEQTFTGVTARVIQHEYDHIDGILFTDHLKPLKRRLLKKKLENIRTGNVRVNYKMIFPAEKHHANR